MKKFNTILAIAAVAVSSVFGLTSCDKENDSYNEVMNYETQTVTEKEQEVQSYNYDANGMWRFEANGNKYTLYVDVPSNDTGGGYHANFYFDGKNSVGRATLKDGVLTFKSDADDKSQVELKATFSDNDSQKFTAEELTIDNTLVAADVTFNHICTPTNYSFTVNYTVVDPNNELASLGTDIQTLNEEVKKHESTVNTDKMKPFKALATMSAQKIISDIIVTNLMKDQNALYPGLEQSNVYVESSVIETYGDIESNLGTSSYTYTAVMK